MNTIHLPSHYFELTRADVVNLLKSLSRKKSVNLQAALLSLRIVSNASIDQQLQALPETEFPPRVSFRTVSRSVYDVLEPINALANYALYYKAMYDWCMGHTPASEQFYDTLVTMLHYIVDKHAAIENRGHTIRVRSADGPLFCSQGEHGTDLAGGDQLSPKSLACYAPGVLSVDIMKPSGQVLYKLIEINFARYWPKKTIAEVNEIFTAMQTKIEQRLARFS